MKVLVVTNADWQNFLSKIKPNLQKVDLVLISYNLFLQISYKDEIENKTNNIEKIIKLSKELNCVIVAGSNYDLFGKHYSSVLTADKGKLLGIADSVYPLSQKASGKELKIYKTKLGKLGIIVNEDIFNLKTAVLLKKFGAKFIINICDFFDIEKQNKAVLEVGKLADKSIFSLNSSCLIFYNNIKQSTEYNFCEFFTKDFKI